jgi:hypothetical protein
MDRWASSLRWRTPNGEDITAMEVVDDTLVVTTPSETYALTEADLNRKDPTP